MNTRSVTRRKSGASTKRKSVISCVEDFKGKLDLVDKYLEIQKYRRKKFYMESKISPSVLLSRLLVDT